MLYAKNKLMEIPDGLIQKYNIPVPRYTSYPPANYFNDGFTENEYLQLINESNTGNPGHIAIYIHIPFCRKICYFCGCNACSIGEGKLVIPYMDALKKEIILMAGHLDKGSPVSQIHYGGGTPNAIPLEFLCELNDFLFERFHFIKNPEIAIECNPGYLDLKYLGGLKMAKFNRFSLGIQDFNRQVTDALNRESPAMPVGEIIRFLKEDIRETGVNLDFIYGLPGQTPASFSDTIAEAIDVNPDRIVTFSYAHVPWLKKHQKIVEKLGLPSSELKMKMFLTAYNLLKNAGYQPIGLDHYVLEHDELYQALCSHELHRNFQGYCTRRTTGEVYAFGVSAISQLERGYAQNTKDITSYIASVNSGHFATEKGYRLDDSQVIIRRIITALMCNKVINWADQAGTFNLAPERLKAILKIDEQVFNDFAREGILEYSPEEIKVTETGSLFIRNIAAAMDPAFKLQSNLYSRSV